MTRCSRDLEAGNSPLVDYPGIGVRSDVSGKRVFLGGYVLLQIRHNELLNIFLESPHLLTLSPILGKRVRWFSMVQGST